MSGSRKDEILDEGVEEPEEEGPGCGHRTLEDGQPRAGLGGGEIPECRAPESVYLKEPRARRHDAATARCSPSHRSDAIQIPPFPHLIAARGVENQRGAVAAVPPHRPEQAPGARERDG